MPECYVLNPNKLLVFIIFILLWIVIGYMIEEIRPQLENEFARKVRQYAPPPQVYYIVQKSTQPKALKQCPIVSKVEILPEKNDVKKPETEAKKTEKEDKKPEIETKPKEDIKVDVIKAEAVKEDPKEESESSSS